MGLLREKRPGRVCVISEIVLLEEQKGHILPLKEPDLAQISTLWSCFLDITFLIPKNLVTGHLHLYGNN